MRFYVSLLIFIVLLGGCATTPAKVLGPVPARVVSFSMEWGLHLSGANGPSEAQPGFFLGSNELFEGPYRESMERLWPEFLERLAQFGRVVEGPPELAEGSGYWNASQGTMSRQAMVFPPPRGRGFVWPSAFRFVDSQEQNLVQLAKTFPGEVLILVEYTGYSEDVADETPYGPPSFRLGLRARIQVFGPDAKLIDSRTILGTSHDSASRRDGRLDRNQFSELFSQAQVDVLDQWLKVSPLRMEN